MVNELLYSQIRRAIRVPSHRERPSLESHSGRLNIKAIAQEALRDLEFASR